MRHKTNKKATITALKYAILDKTTNKITILRFKTQVSALINVSTRTLDRQIPYKNERYEVYFISNVVL